VTKYDMGIEGFPFFKQRGSSVTSLTRVREVRVTDLHQDSEKTIASRSFFFIFRQTTGH